MIWFEIPGQAKGKERPRNGKGYFYTPQNTKDYEELVKVCYRQKYKEPPTKEAVKVGIVVWMVSAKSLSKRKRAELENHPPMKKPDIDNIAKIILDGLNGVAWEDDRQVSSLEIVKLWGHSEKVMVVIQKESDLNEQGDD